MKGKLKKEGRTPDSGNPNSDATGGQRRPSIMDTLCANIRGRQVVHRSPHALGTESSAPACRIAGAPTGKGLFPQPPRQASATSSQCEHARLRSPLFALPTSGRGCPLPAPASSVFGTSAYQAWYERDAREDGPKPEWRRWGNGVQGSACGAGKTRINQAGVATAPVLPISKSSWPASAERISNSPSLAWPGNGLNRQRLSEDRYPVE